MSLFILIIAGFIIWYIISSAEYQKTDYYASTHKSYASVRFNAGNYGEYLTYKYLQGYGEDGAKFLYNCYLPMENNKTTEIDLIMIHSSGIYVFESKNYSGWIFGSEYSRTWTQTLPNGNRARKEHFLNPIMQNKLHIKWLVDKIGESIPIFSVIVFSERCALKKIDLNSTNVYVIKRNIVTHTIREIEGKMGVCMSNDQVSRLYHKLYPFTQVTDDIKTRHIQDIKTNSVGNTVVEGDTNITLRLVDENQICPRCNHKLVLKTTKRGVYAGSQFYGCSNYPKCRYLRNKN